MLRKLLLAASVVCVFVVVPSVASAAALDGEILTGTTASGAADCSDNGDGTSSVYAARPGYSGLAAGPVIGTFGAGRVAITFNNVTGVVTDFGAVATIFPADGTDSVVVSIGLGSGQGLASCAADGSWTLNVTGATYVNDATGDTGVVSVSATGSPAGGTFTAVFGPQLPTSKDQCKNGGWKTFPGFKNQGDCVSYVASKGKNNPAGP